MKYGVQDVMRDARARIGIHCNCCKIRFYSLGRLGTRAVTSWAGET